MKLLKILFSIVIAVCFSLYSMEPISYDEPTYSVGIDNISYTEVNSSNTSMNNDINNIIANIPDSFSIVEVGINESGDYCVTAYASQEYYDQVHGINNASDNSSYNHPTDIDDKQFRIDNAWNSHQDNLAYANQVQQSSGYESTSNKDFSESLSNDQKTFYSPYKDPIDTLQERMQSSVYNKSLEVHKKIAQEQLADRWVTGKQPFRDKIATIDAIKNGSMVKMLDTIKNDNLKNAIKAFDTLKNMYPWKDKITFLGSGQSYGEQMFISVIGIDVMKVAQSYLVGRIDYLLSQGVNSSRIAGSRYQYHMLRKMQLKGDKQGVEKSYISLMSSTDLQIQALVAATESLLSDPLTEILANIKNAPLDMAEKELNSFHAQLLDHFKAQCFKSVDEAKADMLHREGADVLAAANACYESRPDHRQEVIQQGIDLFQNALSQDNQEAINNVTETNEQTPASTVKNNQQTEEAQASNAPQAQLEQQIDVQLNAKIEYLRTIDPEIYTAIMNFKLQAEKSGKTQREIEDFIRKGLDKDTYEPKLNAQSAKIKAELVDQSTLTLDYEQQPVLGIDALDMISTSVSNYIITMTPETNERINVTLNTFHIPTLITILQEQTEDTETRNTCFAVGLESYILLQKYIENPNKQIVAQPDINTFTFNARKDALKTASYSPMTCKEQSHMLTPKARAALQSHGIDPEQFTYCVGNSVQQQLYSEFASILNAMVEVQSNKYTQPLLDMATTYSYAGSAYAQQNNLETAFNLADCAWAALDCAKVVCESGIDIGKTAIPEIAEGMIEGCINAISNTAHMVRHPRETLSNMGAAFAHLGTCLATLACLSENPEDLHFIDPEISGMKAELRQEIIENIIATTKQMTLKDTTAFVTEQIVFGKIVNLGIGVIKYYAKSSMTQLAKLGQAITDKAKIKAPKYVSDLHQKVVERLNSYLVKEEVIAVTADGAKIAVQGTQKEAKVLQSIDKTSETTKIADNLSHINETKPINSNKGKISNPMNSAIQHEAETLIGKNKTNFGKISEANKKILNDTRPRARSFGVPDKKLPELWSRSEAEYKHIRELKGDVTKIAQNTNIPEEIIKTVKQHVFYDSHELIIDIKDNLPVTGIKQFDPNHNISAAWNRLIDGNFSSTDIILLKHEYAEAILMNELKMPYSAAHAISNKYYDWDSLLLRK